jgi:hypothetical protein
MISAADPLIVLALHHDAAELFDQQPVPQAGGDRSIARDPRGHT